MEQETPEGSTKPRRTTGGSGREFSVLSGETGEEMEIEPESSIRTQGGTSLSYSNMTIWNTVTACETHYLSLKNGLTLALRGKNKNITSNDVKVYLDPVYYSKISQMSYFSYYLNDKVSSREFTNITALARYFSGKSPGSLMKMSYNKDECNAMLVHQAEQGAMFHIQAIRDIHGEDRLKKEIVVWVHRTAMPNIVVSGITPVQLKRRRSPESVTKDARQKINNSATVIQSVAIVNNSGIKITKSELESDKTEIKPPVSKIVPISTPNDATPHPSPYQAEEIVNKRLSQLSLKDIKIDELDKESMGDSISQNVEEFNFKVLSPLPTSVEAKELQLKDVPTTLSLPDTPYVPRERKLKASRKSQRGEEEEEALKQPEKMSTQQRVEEEVVPVSPPESILEFVEPLQFDDSVPTFDNSPKTSNVDVRRELFTASKIESLSLRLSQSDVDSESETEGMEKEEVEEMELEEREREAQPESSETQEVVGPTPRSIARQQTSPTITESIAEEDGINQLEATTVSKKLSQSEREYTSQEWLLYTGGLLTSQDQMRKDVSIYYKESLKKGSGIREERLRRIRASAPESVENIEVQTNVTVVEAENVRAAGSLTPTTSMKEHGDLEDDIKPAQELPTFTQDTGTEWYRENKKSPSPKQKSSPKTSKRRESRESPEMSFDYGIPTPPDSSPEKKEELSQTAKVVDVNVGSLGIFFENYTPEGKKKRQLKGLDRPEKPSKIFGEPRVPMVEEKKQTGKRKVTKKKELKQTTFKLGNVSVTKQLSMTKFMTKPVQDVPTEPIVIDVPNAILIEDVDKPAQQMGSPPEQIPAQLPLFEEPEEEPAIPQLGELVEEEEEEEQYIRTSPQRVQPLPKRRTPPRENLPSPTKLKSPSKKKRKEVINLEEEEGEVGEMKLEQRRWQVIYPGIPLFVLGQGLERSMSTIDQETLAINTERNVMLELKNQVKPTERKRRSETSIEIADKFNKELSKVINEPTVIQEENLDPKTSGTKLTIDLADIGNSREGIWCKLQDDRIRKMSGNASYRATPCSVIDRICLILITRFKMTEKSRFIDLGSGYGGFTLQMALSTKLDACDGVDIGIMSGSMRKEGKKVIYVDKVSYYTSILLKNLVSDSFPSLREQMSKCNFYFGRAGSLNLKDYTHLVSFNTLWQMEDLAPVLEQLIAPDSKMVTFVCTKRLKSLSPRLSGTKEEKQSDADLIERVNSELLNVCQLTMRLPGNDFTFYFYIKKAYTSVFPPMSKDENVKLIKSIDLMRGEIKDKNVYVEPDRYTTKRTEHSVNVHYTLIHDAISQQETGITETEDSPIDWNRVIDVGQSRHTYQPAKSLKKDIYKISEEDYEDGECRLL